MCDITARPRLLSVTESMCSRLNQAGGPSDARYSKIRFSRVAGAAGAAADLVRPPDRRSGRYSTIIHL